MQVVYTIVANEKNYYYEQTCVSAFSLRMFNKDVFVILLTDDKSYEYIKKTSSSLLSLFDDVRVVKIDDEYSNKRKSRILKTSIRNIIDGDYLFIDSDTIVCDDLHDVEKEKGDVLAVKDKHLCLDDHPRRQRIEYNLKKIKYQRIKTDEIFFNSGVMFVRDTLPARKLYEVWKTEWEKGLKYNVDSDQPSLLIANRLCNYPIVELDGCWNCQIIENGLKYLVDAKILHYFSSDSKDTCFDFKNNAIYQEVRDAGRVPLFVEKKILDAKKAFGNRMLIVAGDEAAFLETAAHKCYVYHKRVFRIIEKVLTILYGK